MARRWLKIGAGLGAGIITIIGFFQVLALLYGFQIVDLTGNFSCAGTYEDPCVSDFTIRNPNSYYVDIYNKDEVKLDFSPNIKDYALFVKDGRCKTNSSACASPNGIWFVGWKFIDFTNETKPRQDKAYVFRFPAYTTKYFRLAGVKNDPNDEIKWGIGTNGEYLDPIWEARDNITWQNNCADRCVNGACTQSSIGPQYVNDSDGICKPLAEAKSLKNSAFECVVDFDGIHQVECEDFNMTHVRLNVKFDELSNPSEEERNVSILTFKDAKDWNKAHLIPDKAEKIYNKYINKNEEVNIVLELGMNDVIKIGEHSTTIQIQTPTSGNMRDNYVNLAAPTTNYGTSGGIYVLTNTAHVRREYYMFNISGIPSGQAIDNAKLCVYTYSTIPTIPIFYHHVTDHTWNSSSESTQTWNNQPCGLLAFDASGSCNLTAESSVANPSGSMWVCGNVTQMVQREYDNSDKNVSIVLKTSDEKTGTTRYILTYTKEATSANKPYLNVTYSPSGDTQPPTYSNPGVNTTYNGTLAKFSILWDDDTALNPNGQYIFSTNNSGTWVNDSVVNFTATPNWANVSKVLNDTVGTVVGYRWYATDNAGNANSTGIYTLTTTQSAADTCTPPFSGNYDVDCSDNCTWGSDDEIPGNVTMIGNGFLTLAANWTFTGSNQNVYIGPGCTFYVKEGGYK